MVAPPTTEMLVVFALVIGAVVLFVTERLPPDTTAIAVVVALVILQPWTDISPSEAISGFASSATITILAMYILSAGVQETGAIRRLGAHVASFTHGSKRRLLGTVLGLTGPLAGFINNTPVVAMFIPMVTDLADESHISPSKLLIPLSFASMLGGVLTLIGTATNILASDLSASLIGRPFGMFTFTPVGIVVLSVGLIYLFTVAQWLLPERIPVVDLTGKFEMEPYLWRVYVRRPSPLVGQTVEEAMTRLNLDLDILEVVRGERTFIGTVTDREIEQGDILTIRGSKDTVQQFVGLAALRLLPKAAVTEDELATPGARATLIEAVVPSTSGFAGETIAECGIRRKTRSTVLAVRTGRTIAHEDLAEYRLSVGDGLLLFAPAEVVQTLTEEGDLAVTETTALGVGIAPEELPPLRSTNIPVAVGIVLGVVLLAALDLLPIVIAALGGVVAMVVTGVIKPSDAYDAVSWEVIFLLAGVLPLGLALQKSGGASYLAELLVANAAFLPAIVVLGLFYLLTGLLANVVTPVASVVLMLPVAVGAAGEIGADPFAFVLGVTFAASTAFMTPIGYQTNLMVYSAGGYHFTDYFRVGAPLQLLLTVVTPLAITVLIAPL